MKNKIINIYELHHLMGESPDKKWVFTNGCFDVGLTKGHVENLQSAKSLGDFLIVALNSDESVFTNKGKGRPIVPLEERMAVVAALESVDYVISFNDKTPIELINFLKPSLICKGGDYEVEQISGWKICPVRILPTVNSMSTTDKICKCYKYVFYNVVLTDAVSEACERYKKEKCQ